MFNNKIKDIGHQHHDTEQANHEDFLAYHAGDVFGEEEEDYWHQQNHPDNNASYAVKHADDIFGEEDEDYWHVNNHVQDKTFQKKDNTIKNTQVHHYDEELEKWKKEEEKRMLEIEKKNKILKDEEEKLKKIQRQKDEEQKKLELQKNLQLADLSRKADIKQFEESLKKIENKLNAKNLGIFGEAQLDMDQNKAGLMTEIYKNITNCPDIQPGQLNGKTQSHLYLDYRSFAIYWDSLYRELVIFNLMKVECLNRQSFKEFPNSIVKKLFNSSDNNNIFIGFSDGSIHVLELNKNNFKYLQKYHPIKKGYEHTVIDSPVSDIYAKQNTFAVSHQNGQLTIFKRSSKENSDKKFQELFKDTMKYPLVNMVISKDNQFLVGIQKLKGDHIVKVKEKENEEEVHEIKNLQQVVVYNLKKNKIGQNKFVFEQLVTEIKNCFILFEKDDITYLFVASEQIGGINKYQLNDESIDLIDYFEDMHSGFIIDQVLFDDLHTLVSIGNDKTLKVWDIEAMREIQNLPIQPQGYQYTSICLSQDQRYLITSGKDKNVIWFIENWSQICTIKFKQAENLAISSSIHLSKDNCILYSKNSVGDIMYWQIQEPTESIRVNFGEVNIKKAMVTIDTHYLITQDDQGFTYLWNLYSLKKEQTLCENQKFDQLFLCSKDNQFIFLKNEENVVQQWNLNKNDEENTIQYKEEISTIKLKDTDEGLQLLLGIDVDHTFYINDLKKKQQYKMKINVKDNIENENYYPDLCVSTFEDLCIATSSDYCYHIIDIEYPKRPIIKQTIQYHANINYVVLDSFDRLLLIVGDYDARLLDFNTQAVIKEKLDHYDLEDNYKAFFNKSSEKLYTYKGKNRWVIYGITDLNNCEQIADFEGEHQEIVSYNEQLKGIIDEDNEIRYWSDRLVMELSGNYNYGSKSKSLGKSDWKHQQINIKGPLNFIFPQIIKQMLKDNENMSQYIPAMKQNIIEPFKMNLMHYFSYENQHEQLQKCFDIGMKFKRDKFKFTPLKYAIHKKSMKSIECIIQNAVNDKDIFPSIKESEICQLIQRSPNNLVDFLQNGFQEIQENKPLFNVLFQQPQFFEKKRIVTNKEKEFDKQFDLQNLKKLKCCRRLQNIDSLESEPIMLNSFNFKYNFTPGSQSSIDFHWSLQQSKSIEVFHATPIQKLIDYKWQKLKWIGQFQFAVMLIHNIILVLLPYYNYDKIIIIVLTVFLAYFLIFEIISVANKNILAQFLDIWFWIDVSFLMIMIFYLVYEFYNYQLFGQQNWMLAIVNFFSWARCVSQLRAFKQTRIFIHIMKTVLSQLIDFLIIVFFSVISISTTFVFLQFGQTVYYPDQLAATTQTQIDAIPKTDSPYFKDPYNKNGFDLVNKFYRVYEYLFGGFDDFFQLENFQSNTPTLLNWFVVLFVLSQFIISLIMMNLLISIVVDTHTDVMTNISQEDYSQMNLLILKYENMFFWRRKSNEKAFFLHWFEYSSIYSAEWKSVNDYVINEVGQPQKKLLSKIVRLLSESQAEKNKMQLLEKQVFKIGSKQSPSSGVSDVLKKELQNFKIEYKRELDIFKREIQNKMRLK